MACWSTTIVGIYPKAYGIIFDWAHSSYPTVFKFHLMNVEQKGPPPPRAKTSFTDSLWEQIDVHGLQAVHRSRRDLELWCRSPLSLLLPVSLSLGRTKPTAFRKSFTIYMCVLSFTIGYALTYRTGGQSNIKMPLRSQHPSVKRRLTRYSDMSITKSAAENKAQSLGHPLKRGRRRYDYV